MGFNSRLGLCSAAIIAAVSFAGTQARADIIDQWTFETSAPTTAGPITPETQTGTDTAIASHAGNSVYSTPSGNGSAHSWSSTVWAIGDYYEFDVTTTGAPGIYLNFDQTSSNTGPGNFKVQVNTGSGFTDLPSGAYNVINGSWSAGTPVSTTSYSYNLSSFTGLTGVRLVDTSTVSANGGTVGTAGTDRVDNVTFSTTPLATPEPASLAMLTLGGLALLARRRRSA